MGDLVSESFALRRPLLQHVANSLEDQLAEALGDAAIHSKVTFTVVTPERFAHLANERGDQCRFPLVEVVEQISGRIQLFDLDLVPITERLIGELLTISQSDWLSDERSDLPVRKLICVIPPQAKPDGWSVRHDVPHAFELTVAVKPVSAGSETFPEPRLSRPNGGESPDMALIMEGGGVKGLAYVGALEVLAERYRFNWYVGTSAGAITAVFLSAGFTVEEMTQILRQKNFADFFDAKRWYSKVFNLIAYRGFHRAKALTDWIDDLLAQKLESQVRVRMSQIKTHTGRRLTLYASRRGAATLTFDSDKPECDADAAYAARCSMSIPFVFTPEHHQGIRTYDGGLRQNFPVQQILEDHPDTDFIAFYLGPERYESDKNHFTVSDLYSIFLEPNDTALVQKYKDRTVVIDTRPVGVLDFDLSDDEKEFLLACGRAGAHRMLNKNSPACAQAVTARDALKKTVQLARDRKKKAKRSRRSRQLLMLLGFLAFCAAIYYGWGQITAFAGASRRERSTDNRIRRADLLAMDAPRSHRPGPAGFRDQQGQSFAGGTGARQFDAARRILRLRVAWCKAIVLVKHSRQRVLDRREAFIAAICRMPACVSARNDANRKIGTSATMESSMTRSRDVIELRLRRTSSSCPTRC